MNTNYPDLIYNGIIIGLCIQLIILGIIKIFSKDARGIILGFMCFYMASGKIYTYYWPEFNTSIFFNIILGGQKPLFYGPIIFLYVALVDQKNKMSRFLCYYLLPPLLLSLGYIIVKFGFNSFFYDNLFMILNLLFLVQTLFYSYLLLQTRQLFKSIKDLIKPQIYNRYLFFYIGFTIILLHSSLSSLIRSYFPTTPEEFLTLTRYVNNPLEIISMGGIALFVFLESKRVKHFIFGEHIYKPITNIKNEKHIEAFIKKSFFDNKQFLVADFNLKELLKSEGISDKDFKIYIRNTYGKTYSDFINDLKIKEFKTNILNPENMIFDIVSIAEISGFKSKATFYRVFKAKEGITPQQYKQKMTL